MSVKENRFTKRREPFNFMLWLGMAGSALIFLTLLGIYLLRKMGADWQQIPLPRLFLVSTAVIVVSSLTLHAANAALRQDRFPHYRLLTALTLLLGVLFVSLQLLGWQQLIEANLTMRKNPSVGFIYLISGLHVLHILGGIGALGWAFYQSLKNFTYIDSFVFSVNPPNQLKIRLITLYWHFVDVLWLVLFGFLWLQQG
jgi:cytochrome c oxidase subunit III